MNETANQKDASSETELHLMSKELEEAANEFLSKMAELETLLCLVDE
ncbi:MAG: hypothetical protein HY912_22715 [Desulfomonile tiedjei]|uniref:Uncharacterized protein n=1 Tax=Desulfomonile tiedjei TaxID=2358 RepID=A0A9D6V673_9BACT|nr:hypothetical protein [Desulfomonile tiedjei]